MYSRVVIAVFLVVAISAGGALGVASADNEVGASVQCGEENKQNQHGGSVSVGDHRSPDAVDGTEAGSIVSGLERYYLSEGGCGSEPGGQEDDYVEAHAELEPASVQYCSTEGDAEGSPGTLHSGGEYGTEYCG